MSRSRQRTQSSASIRWHTACSLVRLPKIVCFSSRRFRQTQGNCAPMYDHCFSTGLEELRPERYFLSINPNRTLCLFFPWHIVGSLYFQAVTVHLLASAFMFLSTMFHPVTEGDALYLEFTCQEEDSDWKEDLQYHLPAIYQTPQRSQKTQIQFPGVPVSCSAISSLGLSFSILENRDCITCPSLNVDS